MPVPRVCAGGVRHVPPCLARAKGTRMTRLLITAAMMAALGGAAYAQSAMTPPAPDQSTAPSSPAAPAPAPDQSAAPVNPAPAAPAAPSATDTSPTAPQ